MIRRKKIPKSSNESVEDKDFYTSNWPTGAYDIYRFWLDQWNVENKNCDQVVDIIGSVQLLLEQSSGREAECIEKSLKLLAMADSRIGNEFELADRRRSMSVIVEALAEGKGKPPVIRRTIRRPQLDAEDE